MSMKITCGVEDNTLFEKAFMWPFIVETKMDLKRKKGKMRKEE